jgi:hypothetical protein
LRPRKVYPACPGTHGHVVKFTVAFEKAGAKKVVESFVERV